MDLIAAEFEGGLTKVGINAITAYISPFVEKVSPVLAASLLTEREGIWNLLQDASIENFWDYFLSEAPESLEAW